MQRNSNGPSRDEKVGENRMSKLRGSLWSLLIGSGGLLVSSGAALAHHPMCGQTPDTLLTGVLSGIGHPIIGIDHLAFVICVGLASAFVAGRYVTPLAFAAATIAGGAGGGRPDMAEAGAKLVDKIDEAIATGAAELKKQLNG